MRRGFRGSVASLLLACAASAGFGQSGEYNAPGSLGIDPGNERERLTQAIEEAPWRLGRLRIDPWLSLREIAWIEPADQDGDLTVSVGAGLHGYLPIGARAAFAAQILPQYIWWQDRADDRRFGGSYGLGFFYFTERAGIELSAKKSDLDDFVTDEVDRRAAVDSVNYRLRVEVPVGSRLGFFVNAGLLDREVTDTFGGEGDLADLSADVERYEGGLVWGVGSRLRLRAGAGKSETKFDPSVRDRSNEGDYWTVGANWGRAKTNLSFTYRQNDLRGQTGSEFTEFRRATWQGRIGWKPRAKLGMAFYGARDLGYSVESDEDTFLDERLGVRLELPMPRRLSANVFYEEGTRSYETSLREDDLTSWGGLVALPIRGRLRLNLGGRWTETDGELGTKQVAEYRFGLIFGADHRGFF